MGRKGFISCPPATWRTSPKGRRRQILRFKQFYFFRRR
nr:MAG TPA: hypothetical protein [Inoviridae sp.]